MLHKEIKIIFYICTGIGLLMSIVSIFFADGKHASGVIAGAFVGSANFYLLALMIRKMLEDQPSRVSLALRFLLKYGLMGIVIVLVFFWLHVSPLGFLIGLTNLFFALLVGAIVYIGRIGGESLK